MTMPVNRRACASCTGAGVCAYASPAAMCVARDSVDIYEHRHCLKTEHVLPVHRQPWQGGQTEWPIIGAVLRDYRCRYSAGRPKQNGGLR
jgi:hypothetical protein